MNKETQDKVTKTVVDLEASIKAFIAATPDFEGASNLAGNIGKRLADLETVLHWDCGVWGVGLPRDNSQK